MPQPIVEQDIGSFAADPGPPLRQLQNNGTPILLKNGPDGDIVVVPAEEYWRLLAVEEQWESIAAVKQGLADVAAGRTRPAREALAELAAKHRLHADNAE